MSEHSSPKYGHEHLRLVHGGRDRRGRLRSFIKTAEEIQLMDRIQARYKRLVQEHGPVSRAIEEIAAGNQQAGCSVIARRLLELKAVGIPAEQREEIALRDVIEFNRRLDRPLKPAA